MVKLWRFVYMHCFRIASGLTTAEIVRIAIMPGAKAPGPCDSRQRVNQNRC
jgi:hypothetical protein